MMASAGRWLPGVLIVLAAVGLYAGGLRYPLVFDDLSVVGISPGGFRFDSWEALRPRVLSWGSIAATVAVFGDSLAALRVVNLALHAGMGVALYGLIAELLKPEGESAARWPAAAGALFVVLNPAGVYAVAYLSQRSIVMATLFSVLALWCWVRGLRGGDCGWLGGAVACYLAALLSKEHAIMLPAAAVLLLAVERGRISASRWKITAVLVVMALAALVTVWRLRGLVGVPHEPMVGAALAATSDGGEDLVARSALTQLALFWRYGLLWIFPSPELMSIDLRVGIAPDLVWAPGLVSAAGIAGMALYAGLLLTSSCTVARVVAFAVLAAMALFATELATVKVQEVFVLYRSYLWAPMLGVIVAVVAHLTRPLSYFIAALAIVGAVPRAIDRVDSFATPLAVWDDAVRKLEGPAPLADRVYGNRAVALMEAGRAGEALVDLDTAIAMNPKNGRALANRASVRILMGDAAAAERDFALALAAQPVFADAYAARCGLRAAAGALDAAARDCDTALQQQPLHVLARLTRGVIAGARGNAAGALADFDAVLAVEPGNAAALANREVMIHRLALARPAGAL